MSFHKRYINKDNIISIYNSQGIEGLKKWFNADALIVENGIDTNAIIDCLTEDDDTKLKGLINNLTKNSTSNEHHE